MYKVSIVAAILSFSALLHSAPAKNQMQKNEDCPLGSKHMRAAARHIEAGGIGYNNGYTTLEAFIANDPFMWQVMPFLDLRGHVFNDGRFAANAGVGARAMWGCRAYGINGYYDYRQGHHKGYSQISLGLETLGKLWDLRVNGYLPIGGKVSHPYNLEFVGFEGHSILVKRRFEYAMKGIDGEIGFHFGKTDNFDFYAAAGPYYFSGKLGDGAMGGKVRAAGRYKEYIALELIDSFDNVFHNNFQGQITFSLPFGPKSKTKPTKSCCPDTCCYASTLADRMIQPVERQEIVVLDRHNKKATTSDYVVFVDNLSSSLGTYESPFPTLAEAQANSNAGDIIYVFPGDGTTTGMDSGIVLQDNQKLWGSGVAHTLETNLGTITIPNYTDQNPMITNTSQHGVTLAQNNEVSGILINHCRLAGIHGVSPGNLTILNSTVAYSNQENYGYSGIELYFENSDIATVLIDGVNVTQNIDDGIYIDMTQEAIVTATIQNCSFSHNAYDIDIEGYNNSITTLNFHNNTVSNSVDYMYVYSESSNSSQQTYNFTNNQVMGSTSYGLYVELSNPATGTITLAGNNFIGNVDAVELALASSNPIILDIENNRFANTTSNPGLFITNSDGGTVQGIVYNNTFENNNTYGFDLVTTNGSTTCLNMQGNASTGNGTNNYFLENTASTIKISPCNAADLNSGGLFDHISGTITHVESCPSGASCP